MNAVVLMVPFLYPEGEERRRPPTAIKGERIYRRAGTEGKTADGTR